MGIDIYATEESLRHCEHALCSLDLNTKCILFPPEKLEGELAEIITIEQDDKVIYLDRLTSIQRRLLNKYDFSDWDYDDAWYLRSYEEQKSICAKCPVRPSEKHDCNIRIAGYSAMGDFRVGLSTVVWYSKKLSVAQCKRWIDPMDLDGKTPSSKLQELFEKALVKGTIKLPKPEQSFNRILKYLQDTGYKTLWGQASISSNEPALEGFLNTYIYRSNPYTPNEAAELLPYLKIFKGLASKLESDLNQSVGPDQLIQAVQAFKTILANFTTAINMAVKWHLCLKVST